MYSQDTTTAYVKLYEASLEKLAAQYGEGPPEQPATRVEEKQDGN